jgi:hypothetical protein
MNTACMDSYELLREKFRPRCTRVLFIGESRPANGTFFYRGDSRLAKYTCEAFGPQDGPIPEMSSFLERFRALGCFLVDLCPQPVNHLARRERRRAHRDGESVLASTLSNLRPLAIVVVMTAIAQSVARATQMAGIATTPRDVLPFPAQGHEREYVSSLRAIVSRLTNERVLNGMSANCSLQGTLLSSRP